MSDIIDWSKAPEGTTHRIASRADRPWRKFTSNGDFWHDGYGWRPFRRDVEVEYIARPDLQSQPELHGEPTHSDNLAVHGFANAMRLRLSACRTAGRSGWDDPEQCPPQRLAEGLVRAVRAGKLVDVGNYAMMLWKRAGLEVRRVPGWIGEALERREPVEWDGTGLPPVGALVEVNYKGQAPYEALVVAEHLGEVVLWIGNGARTNYWRCDPGWLRPILTPEERAAKERDEAVAAMLDSSGFSAYDNVTVQQVCEALHAAGYRKTEGE